MKKPKTLKELYNLVNPKDILDILDFSGKNDKQNTTHWDLRRKYSNAIFHSTHEKKYNGDGYYSIEKEPSYTLRVLEDDFYETLIKCMQDFYWWSRKHCHSHAHIHIRVMNALDIKVEDIEKHVKEKEVK